MGGGSTIYFLVMFIRERVSKKDLKQLATLPFLFVHIGNGYETRRGQDAVFFTSMFRTIIDLHVYMCLCVSNFNGGRDNFLVPRGLDRLSAHLEGAFSVLNLAGERRSE